MFEPVEVVAARLLTDPPTQDDPCQPTLDPDGTRLARAVELERLKSAVDAELMLVYTAMATDAQTWLERHDPGYRNQLGSDDLVAAEIAPALRLAPRTAAIRVHRATRVVTRLPLTLAAYRRGELDLGRVLTIDDATSVLSDDDAATVEALVLARAVDQTAAELRAALRKAVITVDPDAAEKRRKAAVKARSVTKYQDDDGTSELRAVLSAADAADVYDVLDELARQSKTPNDPRTVTARRADALVEVVTGHGPNPGPEDPPNPRHDDPPGDPEPEPDPDPDDRPVPDEPTDLDERFGPNPNPPTPHTDPTAPDTDPGPVTDPTIGPASDPTGPVTDPTGSDRPDPADPVVDGPWLPPAPEPDDLHERHPPDPHFTAMVKHALAAMVTHRPPKLPWVVINETTNLDGDTVLVGELQGYGPVTADYANHLLATGAARPPPPQTDREPTPEQAARHDPPDWLAEEVKARDGTCRFAGCRQPAHRVDLDHVIEHPHGPTVRTNLGGLCRRHHQLKTSRVWRAVQHPDGVYQWTSNLTGRTYQTYPRGHTGEWRGTTSIS